MKQGMQSINQSIVEEEEEEEEENLTLNKAAGWEKNTEQW